MLEASVESGLTSGQLDIAHGLADIELIVAGDTSSARIDGVPNARACQADEHGGPRQLTNLEGKALSHAREPPAPRVAVRATTILSFESMVTVEAEPV